MYAPSKDVNQKAVASGRAPRVLGQVGQLHTDPVDVGDTPARHALEVVGEPGRRQCLQVGDSQTGGAG